MENHERFHHDDLLERAVDAVLRDPIPGQLSPDRVTQLAAVVRQEAERPYTITLITRIKNMRPRTRIAVAAACVIVVFCLLPWLTPGGAALAFADVAEALNGVRTATWRATTVVKDRATQGKSVTISQIGMFLAPSHERTERTTNGQTQIGIIDGEKDKILALNPAAETALILSMKNLPPGMSLGKDFLELREMVAGAQSGKGGEVERLGVETIDGRRAEGFRFRLGPNKRGPINVTIWADPKTLLPIRVENVSADVRTVMTDFRVNVDLDKSLFSLDVPAGYTVRHAMQVDASNPLCFLADVLKAAAECNDGVFPPELQGEQGFDGILKRAADAALKATGEKQGKASADALKQEFEAIDAKFKDASMKLPAALASLHAMPPGSARYTGKGVKLGTPNRPIFWVTKKMRNGKYMVLYADLSFKWVSVKELPKMPQSEEGSKP